jgi:hypothetical protein
MPIIRLPSQHDTNYPAARGPVLLLSCMDLRCMDEIVQFMDHDGLTNRYDHVILAGAALGATGVSGKYPHWSDTFDNHLKIAYDLHHIKDVYILEHRDCGAYAEFLGRKGSFEYDDSAIETATHLKYARRLKRRIKRWAKKKKTTIRVKSFLMDLRGRVDLLDK